ncbi:MAG: V-type ATP synthase subunit A, partial [Planctomycetes bacterium]|nr:V-type ATP synthase subunit A [Planctomycetota bacterium]
FHEVDTYTSMEKQYEMLKTILHFHKKGLEAIENDVDTEEIFKLAICQDIARAKFVPEEQIETISKIKDKIDKEFKAQLSGAKNA